jgi:hypothetical protein
MLEITKKPFGMGKERICFVHPEDPRLAIKIARQGNSERWRREIRFYRKLQKRGGIHDRHVPGFHGLCETNHGTGIVVDLIRNYDGEIARPLDWFLAQGYPIEDFEPSLEEMRQSFLRNLIVFNRDMTVGSLLVQKLSATKARLVAIDGLGDVVAIDWLDFFPFLVRRKIERRWRHFIEGVYRCREIRQQREALEPDS